MTRRTLILTSVLLLTAHRPSVGQDRLRWNFRAGEKLNYSLIQNMDSATKIGEETLNTSFDQTIDMSWQVQSSAANGDAVLSQVFDRVRLKMVGPPAGTVEFDSNESVVGKDNPIQRTLHEVFNKIVGESFEVSMKATGDITDVKIPQSLREAVAQSAAGRQGAINQQMMTDMMKHASVLLPAGSVKPGAQWNTTQEMQMPFGKMTINSAMTYSKKDTDGVAIIDFVPTVKIESRKDANLRPTLTGSTGRGRIKFDVARGRVKQTILELTLNMTVESNGRKLPQTIRNHTSMTLVQ